MIPSYLVNKCICKICICILCKMGLRQNVMSFKIEINNYALKKKGKLTLKTNTIPNLKCNLHTIVVF